MWVGVSGLDKDLLRPYSQSVTRANFDAQRASSADGKKRKLFDGRLERSVRRWGV
jgi:hypothetical protein